MLEYDVTFTQYANLYQTYRIKVKDHKELESLEPLEIMERGWMVEEEIDFDGLPRILGIDEVHHNAI